MHLDYLILAEAASALQGRMFIHGAGITRIVAPELPWIEPQLAVAAYLMFDPEFDAGDHELELRVADVDGTSILPPSRTAFYVPVNPSLVEGEPYGMNIALTLAPLPFRNEGGHTITLLTDGAVMGQRTFGVVIDPDDPAHESFLIE